MSRGVTPKSRLRGGHVATYEWFRVYNEILGDQKMRGLTGDQFRAWVFLLALANQSAERGTVIMDDPEGLADVLRLQLDELEPTLARFERLRMVERDSDGSITITNFLVRQYDKPSDAPAQTAKRKQRSRGAKNVNEDTGAEQDDSSGHADVTPKSRDVTRCHAADTDTDTDSTPQPPLRTIESGMQFDTFWNAYPKRQRMDRDGARREWYRLMNDEQAPDWTAVVAAACNYDTATKGEMPKFIKRAKNFLSDGTWRSYVAGADGACAAAATDDSASAPYVPDVEATKKMLAALAGS